MNATATSFGAVERTEVNTKKFLDWLDIEES